MKKLLCILIIIVSLFNISIVYADNQIDIGIKDTYDYIDDAVNSENTKEENNEEITIEYNEENKEFEEIYQNPLEENTENSTKIEELTQNIVFVEQINETEYNSFNLDPIFFNVLTDDEKIILDNTYDFLLENGYDENSFRYKAIKMGLTMLHWDYSRDTRWKYVEKDGKVYGMRDCSSFVYNCFAPYTTFFDPIKLSNTSTTSILYTIRNKKMKFEYEIVVNLLKESYGRDWLNYLDDYLKPGDLLLCTRNPDREENIGHVMIYLYDGYVLHAGNGMCIEKYATWHIYGEKTENRCGPKYIISIPDEYDRHIDFDLKYRNFEKYYTDF